MIDSPLLAPLNESQYQAVTADAPYVLVLAGAGSGKTRVLVHRIAWLIRHANELPHQILAVTFTNKSAGEMGARVERLVGGAVRQQMWLGTFHGLAHKLLRIHWQAANLSQYFHILDSDDQKRLLKKVIREIGLDEKYWPPQKAQWFINDCKERGLRADHVEHFNDAVKKTLIQIYQCYQQQCEQNNWVDFTELLLRSYELLRDNAELLKHYQERFHHILVDEFQDTNTLQYAWLKLLAGNQGSVMVVGDDDQSIYGWRGAKIENIRFFQDQFADVQLIRLEQNYRSTQVILDAANQVIKNNRGRLGKQLWTDEKPGDLISLYHAYNEIDEARFVVGRIQTALESGVSPSDIAILYRSNAQSRIIEENLLYNNINYRVYGGLRFYDRAEIKDALAYLRLIHYTGDDAAFERATQVPPRGLGNKTMQVLRDCALQNQTSLWQAAEQLILAKALSPRALNSLNEWMMNISELHQQVSTLSLGQLVEKMIQRSGLIEHFRQEKGEKGQTRIDNLFELVQAAEAFANQQENDMSQLTYFLANAILDGGDYEIASQEAVQLMTLHSAKGLEFSLVFICGLEEGLFPHYLSLQDAAQVEEERRLCYVGMTRAKQKLYLSYAEKRRLHGNESSNLPSRFLSELPSHCIEEIRLRQGAFRSNNFASSSFAAQNQKYQGLQIGQRVHHQTFGEGIILAFEGDSAHKRVQVNFEYHGAKWLVVAFAKLSPL